MELRCTLRSSEPALRPVQVLVTASSSALVSDVDDRLREALGEAEVGGRAHLANGAGRTLHKRPDAADLVALRRSPLRPRCSFRRAFSDGALLCVQPRSPVVPSSAINRFLDLSNCVLSGARRRSKSSWSGRARQQSAVGPVTVSSSVTPLRRAPALPSPCLIVRFLRRRVSIRGPARHGCPATDPKSERLRRAVRGHNPPGVPGL